MCHRQTRGAEYRFRGQSVPAGEFDGSSISVSEGAVLSDRYLVLHRCSGGWLAYDGLCRLLRGRERLLAAALFVFVVAMCWGLAHVFSARAAYLHVGVMLGTSMVANVFFVIIPGQKAMVADILAGREPDPAPGLAGKQRSVHNTYFTLPVLFTMISNHYPMTYSHPYGWAVLAVALLPFAGVLTAFGTAPLNAAPRPPSRDATAVPCGVGRALPSHPQACTSAARSEAWRRSRPLSISPTRRAAVGATVVVAAGDDATSPLRV